jgi:hypothetical protein
LRAHLSLGRMYYNLQTKDNTQMAEYLFASLKEYSYCVYYNKAMNVPGVELEISMSQQMVDMLPLKIRDLRRSN